MDMENVKEEASLRTLLAEKPNNAKAMARLSVLLAERAHGTKNEDPLVAELLDEALLLAKKAIHVKPELPWGYGALSTATDNFEERMNALEKTVELSSSGDGLRCMTTVAYARALTQLLVEPREEEKRIALENSSMGSAAAKHPSRRELSESEDALYTRIKEALVSAWESCEHEENVRFLSEVEFCLGLFFRKLEPVEAYRPCARRHLRIAYQKLPKGDSLSEKALFWDETLKDYELEGEDELSVVDFDRCPEDYVTSLYASFAERFDKLMVGKLLYTTPTKLRCLLDRTIGFRKTGKWALRGADLGCGTGLSGLAFRQCVEHFEGVDLSAEMIERAKRRGCYNNLVVGEMTVILGPRNKYDLIVSCDALVYIGDLRTTFAAVRQSLSHVGFFAFSTEFLEEEVAPSRQFVLQPCARFAHKLSYIEKTLANEGMQVMNVQVCPIRKNKGEDVVGILVVASVC